METVRFDELELQPQILRGIKAMGFEEATPIQSQAIPVVMSGSDVIGQAQRMYRMRICDGDREYTKIDQEGI